MKKEYYLFHPDVHMPRGRSQELLDELISRWREGCEDVGSEFAAVASLLADEAGLPHIAHHVARGGVVQNLIEEFGRYLNDMPKKMHPAAASLIDRQGLTDASFHVAGLGCATGAIQSALVLLGVEGGEVITTSLNYTGVPNAIITAGAKPVFVDIDERTWCMDPSSLKGAIGKKTRAIIFTHVNMLADMAPIHEAILAGGRPIPVIQDASLAVGSTCNGVKPGVINIGERGLTVISLATSKTISGLGGAVIVANNKDVVDRIITYSYQGVNPANGAMESFGTNFKMNDINAVIALEQLRRRDSIFRRRRKLKALYDECLGGLTGNGAIKVQDVGGEAVLTHYGIEMENRDRVAMNLHTRHGICLGMWFVHHMQKIYEERFGKSMRPLRITENMSSRVAFLPFHTRLADSDVEFICECVAKEFGR